MIEWRHAYEAGSTVSQDLAGAVRTEVLRIARTRCDERADLRILLRRNSRMEKRRLGRNVLSFTAVFEPDPAEGCVVHIPALPRCVTQGESFEEAKKNAQDAVEGYLAVHSSFLCAGALS